MKLFGNEVRLGILDFDGVVVDLMANYGTILRQAARLRGLPLEPIEAYLAGHCDGSNRGHPRFSIIVRSLWPWLSENDARAYYWAFRGEEERIGYPPIPGSIEAIGWLRENGIMVALCTMNDERAIASKLKHAGIDPAWFHSIATRERAGYEKPDPRILEPIFADVSVKSGDSFYVGDWYADIEVANRAGIPFVAVLSGGLPRHAFIREGVPEDHIIGSLAELPKLITE
ncbi:MAG: HAD family hydrolase [Candidatus Sungbacteria bacterium]|uniref:HAD family hydrolase n=1 Tax=Candidatus Sungiibacteriota bacterium TaxID=2750080 RepID=A0A932YVB5_9BACT|nr:HAD family hydrolase [Candidatus Sungbacteria bacterium]